MNNFNFTIEYINKHYVQNNKGDERLEIGDFCIVHPHPSSQFKASFRVRIVLRKIKWPLNDKEIFEVCTDMPRGHPCVINDYLFNRLEKSKRKWYEYIWYKKIIK